MNISDLLLDVDPVHFVDRNLQIKGQSFNLANSGRDYLGSFYRHLVFENMKTNSMPVVVVKGRQIELTTTMIGYILYLMGSGHVGEDNIIDHQSYDGLPVGQWPYHHLTVCYTFPTSDQCSRFYNDNDKFMGVIKQSKHALIDRLRDQKGKQSLGHTQFKRFFRRRSSV
jgi:hypothetical protein